METTKQYLDKRSFLTVIGPQNVHLKDIEEQMNVQILMRGNELTFSGSSRDIELAIDVIDTLLKIAKKNGQITKPDLEQAFLKAQGIDLTQSPDNKNLTLKTTKRHINPRTQTQADFVDAMNRYEMVFGLGPAGTGKTFLAVAKAVSMMLSGDCDKIILTRPAVEAGENLGFLPGDLKEKIDPYLRPLYDALYDMLPSDQVDKKLENGEIEIAPLAYMRGRTLTHSVVILDEAQNTTAMQMKMFLTRLGEGSRMVINGDLSQTDLPRGVKSGLADALEVVRRIPDIKVVEFSEKDVVRHGLVSKIVKAYDARKARINDDKE